MLFGKPRGWRRSLKQGAGSGPARGGAWKPATCCLAALVKINEAVVSQQGRKDLQTGARTGFGGCKPSGGGPQLNTSASGLLGFLSQGLFFN